MKVIDTSNVQFAEMTSKMFIGEVRRNQLIDEMQGQGLRMGLAKFSPGSRTVSHTHTSEQVLFVVEGKGILATETEENVVTPGTLIYIPPKESHWHGATKDSSFSHLSIQMPGKTNF
ncbi:cupin domain-containing protein [Chloroflexota bacterium]